MQRILKIVAFLALFSVIVTTLFLSYDFIKTRDAFPAKTFIGNIDVSCLTQEEALKKMRKTLLSHAFTELITIEADGNYFSFPPQKLGVYVLYEKSVKRAFEATHKDNYVLGIKEHLLTNIDRLPLLVGINDELLKSVLVAVAEAIRSSPKDSSIIYYEETGGYHIEPEEIGREIDIEKSIASFKSSIYKRKKTIPLAINYSYPQIREKDLRAHPPVHRLAAYTTYYGLHDSANRIHNIKLIASWIDGTLLMSGESFSTSDVLGAVTYEQGFKEALVIVGGELVPLLGGGACQIATTLYNAVALADLKILQRKNHSFYFNIYPLGRDATVYPGQLDFKFENDSGFPVLIKAIATNKKLSFRLYGTPSNKRVRFSRASVLSKNSEGKYVPASLKKVIDKDVPFKTLITRRVYNKEGKEIKKEEIYSYYKLYGDKTNVPIRKPEAR